VENGEEKNTKLELIFQSTIIREVIKINDSNGQAIPGGSKMN
jgi:hypothetical protein